MAQLRLLADSKRRLLAVSAPITLLLFLLPLGAMAQAQPIGHEPLTPIEVFKRASPSCFLIESIGLGGKVLAFGSGVAISSSEVITNRHVIEDAQKVVVHQGGNHWDVSRVFVSTRHDLCLLEVAGLSAVPLKERPSSSLEIGERVFAIGNPQGLETTFSDGIISGLRQYEGGRLIQTSAPISPGSSGGGLFDLSARLVGITTSCYVEGQNLNFALPSEWVIALRNPSCRVEVTITKSPKEGEASEWSKLGKEYRSLPLSEQGSKAFLAKSFAEAAALFQEALRADPGDFRAWANLGLAYERLWKFQNAVDAEKEAVRIAPGYANGWNNLGVAYLGLNNWNESIAALKEAVRLQPDLADAWSNLGVALINAGRVEDAIGPLNTAVGLSPTSVAAWQNLGLAYSKQGNRERVIYVYEQLKRVDKVAAESFFNRFVIP